MLLLYQFECRVYVIAMYDVFDLDDVILTFSIFENNNGYNIPYGDCSFNNA